MADFTVRSDGVDVDEIMKQIRTRIREKRGADDTEADLQHLAKVKVEQFKRQRTASPAPKTQEGGPPAETGGFIKRRGPAASVTASPQDSSSAGA